MTLWTGTYFKRLQTWLFLPIRVVTSSSVCLPREATVSPTWGTQTALSPPLWIKVPSDFTKTGSTGRSPTCLFRGGDGLGVGSSGLGQRELTGGSEEGRRTGLPIPETRHSWKEEGESEKAATGNMKEKVSETLGGRRGREAGRESLQVQRQQWAELPRARPSRELEPWFSVRVNSKSWSPPPLDNV